MSKPTEFATYYYAIQIQGELDLEKYIFETKNHLNNKEWYEIEQINNSSTYFIKLANKYNANVLPKKWNSKNLDVRTLKTIELEDDEGLFQEMYICLTFECTNLLQNCAWIISVLKSWKQESSGILDAFFKELFKVYNQVLTVNPITYRDQKKYLKSLSKISRLSFKVAWTNLQTQLWVSPKEWLSRLFEIRDELWGDDFTLSILARNGLKKNAVIDFTETYTHVFKNSTATVEVVDNMWKRIQQQIDEIRFKSNLSLVVELWALNYEEVKARMVDDMDVTLEQIKVEYSPKK